MSASALNAAFKTALKTYAQTAQLAVDWGDEKEYNPQREQWLRPRLNPSMSKPGPSNLGPLRAELRGLYSVECMTPIEDGTDAAFTLADNVADHFMPNWAEPAYVTSATLRIHILAPSVVRIPALDDFNRAAAHIPYLAYVIA